MYQWLQVVERSANEKSLELRDEKNVHKVEKSILQERVAGSKRAQARCAKRKREMCDAFPMSKRCWYQWAPGSSMIVYVAM